MLQRAQIYLVILLILTILFVAVYYIRLVQEVLTDRFDVLPETGVLVGMPWYFYILGIIVLTSITAEFYIFIKKRRFNKNHK